MICLLLATGRFLYLLVPITGINYNNNDDGIGLEYITNIYISRMFLLLSVRLENYNNNTKLYNCKNYILKGELISLESYVMLTIR